MSLTIFAIVWIITIACIGGVTGIVVFCLEYKKAGVVTWVVTLATVILMMFLFNWYYTSYAPGIRAYKTDASARENGLYREIIITAEDGREIYYFKGKVDIETDPEKNYIMFEDENEQRHIIYYSLIDTIIINEISEGD